MRKCGYAEERASKGVQVYFAGVEVMCAWE